MTIYDKLEQIAAAYEQKAQGLRLAAMELKGTETAKAHEHLNGKITKAAMMRGENLNGRAKVDRPRKKATKHAKPEKGAFKAAAIALLRAQPDSYLPKDEFMTRLAKKLGVPHLRAIGALARYKIIKSQGNGYVLGKGATESVSQGA